MKEGARRFQKLLHAEWMYHQRRGETWYTDGIANVEQYTIEGGGYGRGHSYNGEKSKGSTNERGDDKLRMDHTLLDP